MTVYYQSKSNNSGPGRWRERVGLSVVSLLFLTLAYLLHGSHGKDFVATEAGYQDSSIINLLPNGTDVGSLARALADGGFCSEPDARLTATHLTAILNRGAPLENLGSLNKGPFLLKDSFFSAIPDTSSELRLRFEQSQSPAGIDFVAEQFYRTGNLPPDTTDGGEDSIAVEVYTAEGKTAVQRRLAGILNKQGQGVPHVLVKLQRYDTSRNAVWIRRSAYAATDKNGKAKFRGLVAGGAYSAQPVRSGFEYGQAQGTTAGRLTGSPVFSFSERPHTMRLLSSALYRQIKWEGILTIRTPETYTRRFVLWCGLFLAGYWLLHVYWTARRSLADQLILPLVMALTGLSVLMLYAINDPLRDTLLGAEMVQGTLVGLVLMGAAAEIRVVDWYNSRKFDGSRLLKKWEGKRSNQPGYLYLAMALALGFLLLVFGTGPDGSDARVNLGPVQPSEMTKYLMVVFFAAFFTRNLTYFADLDASVSMPGSAKFSFGNARMRFVRSLRILVGLALLLALYIKLGDMGPALVLCGLFIVFYSVTRGDLAQLCVGAGVYLVALWIVRLFAGGSGAAFALVTGLFCVGWFAYGWVRKRTFYPSAFYLAFLVSAFVYGQKLPNVGQRLADRNLMFTNIWDNQIESGDQVAQGIWAVTSGGLTGQGIGKGNPNLIPTNHTDMILASIGEEFGFVGLLGVFCCMALLLYRGLTIARRAGSVFAFYLAAGISVVTAIQFLIITSGSFGLMPLTGITVPFLSYGKTSLILNMGATGLLLAASRIRPSEIQTDYIRKRFHGMLGAGLLSYGAAAASLLVILAGYMIFHRDNYLIKPALVADDNGAVIISKNPRIDLLLRKLHAGNIYDREHRLLATSNRDSLIASVPVFREAGLPDSVWSLRASRRQRRYYPFGDFLFFWIGDVNSRTYWGNNDHGYFAENRHFSLLRGLNESADSVYRAKSSPYRRNRFVGTIDSAFELPYAYGTYAQLLPFLKAGTRSNKVQEFDQVRKDVSLTVDARLQTMLERKLHHCLNNGEIGGLNGENRTSVVVINPASGEVLSSAVYPLPSQPVLRRLSYMRNDSANYFIDRISFPSEPVFTERDLGISFPTQPGSTIKMADVMAALNQEGPGIQHRPYLIDVPKNSGKACNVPDASKLKGGSHAMKSAFTYSSNIYFIKLVNDLRLDASLMDVFFNVGIGLDDSTYRLAQNYYLYTNVNLDAEARERVFGHWRKLLSAGGRKAVFDSGQCPAYQTTFSKMAYGEESVKATPIVMARLAGAAVTGGVLKASRFVLRADGALPGPSTDVQLTSLENANILKEFMYDQSNTVTLRDMLTVKSLDYGDLFGKTGTARRGVPLNDHSKDGWYVLAILSPERVPLVVGIRAERIGQGQTSSAAVEIAREVVLPALDSCDYIQSK